MYSMGRWLPRGVPNMGRCLPRGVPNKEKCVFLPGDKYLALIGVKIYMMVFIGPGQVFSRLGVVPPGDPQNFSPLKSEYVENVSRSDPCQLELVISSTPGQLAKTYSMGRWSPQEVPSRIICIFCPGTDVSRQFQ